MGVFTGEFTMFTFILELAGNGDPESGSAISFELENIGIQIFEEIWLERVHHWLAMRRIEKAI